MSPQTIVLIGRSGCGKGTQAKLINAYLHEHDSDKRPSMYVETGAKFREFIKSESYTSRLSREIYGRNERQPDFLSIWTWSHFFVENLTGEEHVTIDGTPRSFLEASVLDNALGLYKRQANIVFLNVSREWSEKKLLARGRADDAHAGIQKVLNWFDSDVMPAIEFLRSNKSHNFIEVNGEQPIEKVHADIVAALKIF